VGRTFYQWTKHCVEKYGADEVNKWYWEVWNEPNISYWHGTHADYFKLYDYAVDGVRRALADGARRRAGNGGRAGRKFLREFLNTARTGQITSPAKSVRRLDFISFHAKGSPVFTNGHVRMGMANQLRNMNDAFAVIASFPEYKKTPIVIGESDPEGCAACTRTAGRYRNGTMYSSYTAASFPRAMNSRTNTA
jgi:xylan 1,4-beta-xylosidase